jgi:hypothetical protein
MKKETLLKELVRLTTEAALKPNEFTAEDYIKERRAIDPNITADACRGSLARLVNSGVLTMRKTKQHGRQCNAYSSK